MKGTSSVCNNNCILLEWITDTIQPCFSLVDKNANAKNEQNQFSFMFSAY